MSRRQSLFAAMFYQVALARLFRIRFVPMITNRPLHVTIMPLRSKVCSCTEHVGGEIQSAEVILYGFGATNQFYRPVTA